MQKLILPAVFFLIYTSIWAQTPLSGVINHYAEVQGIDTDCKSLLMVSDTTGFRVGAELLMIQMQGASINTDNNAGFGNYTSNPIEAGVHEKALIDSVALGEIYLQYDLVHDYIIDGAVQIISIPSYEDVLVQDTLRPKAWDGVTGGVLMLEVEDSLTLEAPITASELGFRGGAASLNLPNNCQWFIVNDDFAYSADSWRGAMKGEGVAKPVPGREAGKGGLANGGGGGNDHNAGGGGGAHFFSGGRGGENDEPSTFGCRGRHPGESGWVVPRSFPTNEIYMGGGGGAGHANNIESSRGGNGGGIIIIEAQWIGAADAQTIEASGESAPSIQGDGAGGGGAGGTLVVIAEEIAATVNLLADGGDGGSLENAPNRCMGPGGGGSGGSIYLNLSSPFNYVRPQGGSAGVSSQGSCNGLVSNGATDGMDGFPNPFIYDSIPQSEQAIVGGFAFTLQPETQRACSGDQILLQIDGQGANLSYQWEVDMGTGFQPLFNNAIYAGTQSPQLTINNVNNSLEGNLYRCLVDSDCSIGQPSLAAVLTIVAEPEITALPQGQSVCEGESTSFSLQALGTGLLYQWQCNDGNDFVDVVDNSIYSGANTATLTISTAMTDAAYRCLLRDSCGIELSSAEALLQVANNPIADFSFNTSGGTVIFNDQSSNGTTWLWDFGDGQSSNLPSPSHTYLNEGSYTVTLTVSNSCGTDVFTQVIQIIIQVAPEAAIQLDRQQGCLPLMVQFSDSSSGVVDTRLWTFEGGDPATSTDPDPIVVYRDEGSFDVRLEVSNSAGNSIVLEEELIVTAEPARAEFDYTENGLVFSFQNLSSNATSFQWNFGDGSPIVTEENPIHEYAGNGAYTVTLIASNAFCASAISIPIDINIVSISEFLEDHKLQLYPNPVHNYLTVNRQSSGAPLSLKVYSVEGQLLEYRQLEGQGMHILDWTALPSGLYLLEFRQEDQRAITKWVKQ